MAVASFTLVIRAGVQQSSAVLAVAEAEALADAGIHIALLDMISAQADVAWRRRFPADARIYGCSVGEGRISIMVADEAGKVDLNYASERLLRALLKGLGVPAADAARLASAIMDYRGTDSARPSNVAEGAELRQADRKLVPKNAPFDAILELAHVSGIGEPLLSRLLPYVTVSSGLGGVDPRRSTPELLAILAAGATDFAAPLNDASPGSLEARIPEELRAVSAQRAYSIRAQATGPRKGHFAREVVVRLSRSDPRPFQIVSWRQVNAVHVTSGLDLGSC